MWLMLLALADEPAPATCCADASIQRNLREYLRMQRSLAAADDTLWAGVLFAWEPVAREAVDALPAPDRPVMQELAAALRRIKGTPDRDRAIAAFPEISRLMTWLAVRHAGGEVPFVEGDCDGRTWLQAPGELASPYGCGSLR